MERGQRNLEEVRVKEQKFEFGDTVRIKTDFQNDGSNWNTYEYRGGLAIVAGSYEDQFGGSGDNHSYTLYFLNKQGNKIIGGSSWHNEYCLEHTHIYKTKGLKKLITQKIGIGHSDCSLLIKKLIKMILEKEEKE